MSKNKKIYAIILAISLVILNSIVSFSYEFQPVNDEFNLSEAFSNSTIISGDNLNYLQFKYEHPISSTTRNSISKKAVTYFTLFVSENQSYKINHDFEKSGGGSNHRYDWDDSFGVKAYTTIYYKESSDGSTIGLTSISGGYKIDDVSLSVSSQKLIYAQSQPPNVMYRKEYTPTRQTWSITIPSTWKPVSNIVELNRILGCAYSMKITRGSETWELYTINNILADGFFPGYPR